MKILTITDMLEAAMILQMPEYRQHTEALEAASTALAQSLANHLHIKLLHDAIWEGKEFEGLAADFGPAFKDQPCPEIIHELDKGGDWIYSED